MRRSNLLSLPNVVSLSRVVCAAGVLVAGGTGERVALIGIASASDFLDGWLARRRKMTTRLGAMLDPVADRCFVLACVAALVIDGALSTGQALVILSRDLATAVGFLVARSVSWLRAAPFQARSLGKVVTALQLATLLAALLLPAVVDGLIVAIALASAASVADYTLALFRARAT